MCRMPGDERALDRAAFGVRGFRGLYQDPVHNPGINSGRPAFDLGDEPIEPGNRASPAVPS